MNSLIISNHNCFANIVPVFALELKHDITSLVQSKQICKTKDSVSPLIAFFEISTTRIASHLQRRLTPYIYRFARQKIDFALSVSKESFTYACNRCLWHLSIDNQLSSFSAASCRVSYQTLELCLWKYLPNF